MNRQMSVAIVDAFSTGVNLAQQFIDKGVECYHIRSTRQPYPFMVAFTDTLYYEGNASILTLCSLHLSYIIAGSEMGVALADYLNSKLGLPCANSALTTAKRRNKYEMHHALAEQQLKSIAQYKSTDKKNIISWVIARGVFPVVIKPLSSAASDGVTVTAGEDVVPASDRINAGRETVS